MPQMATLNDSTEPRAIKDHRGPSGLDAIMILIWTAAIVVVFWDAVSLRGAMFYFDVTEINYPYRAFFADELKAGRFSRWHPGLYCGMPLYSESQAGYLHPLKYLLYPWLPNWRAFNLDTVLSVWLAGVGTYGWLRSKIGPTGALTGAAVFGLSGFMWGHLIHTSMINSLASVPFVVWGLESAWRSGRGRGLVVGGFALACQIFAGHLQGALFSVGLVGLQTTYRAATEMGPRGRARILGQGALLIALGVLISGVQWVPSKILLDQSPRAGGLSWDDLTFGSWHPELLPTVILREAYGTRARDTDWMDGYYPYHEMNTYLGLITIVLAAVGVGSPRDRERGFWFILVCLAGVLMLGRYTFLFDYANRIPVLGSSREPVRFHLWVSLGMAVLAGMGVERIARPGAPPSLRRGLALAGLLVALSVPIMLALYMPVWTRPLEWVKPYHLLRYRWLGREIAMGVGRNAVLSALALGVAWMTMRSRAPRERQWWAFGLPLLVMIDLASAHWRDAPTVDPGYWTDPPRSAVFLKGDPSLTRIFGIGDKSAGEPGYASEPVDFLTVRDPLDWSLPPVWGVPSAKGNTPMISRRLIAYFDHTVVGRGRHDIESTSHIVTGRKLHPAFASMPFKAVGAAFVHKNTRVMARARLAGRPVYAASEGEAIAALDRLTQTNTLRDHLVVEDPNRPLAADAIASGSARITAETPERVEIAAELDSPAYLVVSDTFDPGWSATVDERPAAIFPAYVAFRAIYLEKGSHVVVFNYRPAGLELGLGLSGLGVILSLVLWLWPSGAPPRDDEETRPLAWPEGWRKVFAWGLFAIVVVSIPTLGANGRPTLQSRWRGSVHTHTWGSGLAAMRANRQ